MTFQPLIFHSQQLDPVAISETLQNTGCALVREVFEKNVLTELYQRILSTYAELDQQPAHDESSPFSEYRHVTGQQLETPWSQPYWLYHLLLKSPLKRIFRAYFGNRFHFMFNNTIFRYQRPDNLKKHTPFHQDGCYLGINMPIVNAWIPLVPCGEDAPSLEMIPVGLQELLPIEPASEDKKEVADVEGAIGNETISQRFKSNSFWHPVFDVGDVMLFNHLTVHRTYVTPEMSKERISLEVRTIPGSYAVAQFWNYVLIQVHLRGSRYELKRV